MTRKQAVYLAVLVLGVVMLVGVSLFTNSITLLGMFVSLALMVLGLAGSVFLSNPFQVAVGRIVGRATQGAIKKYISHNEERLVALIASQTTSQLNQSLEENLQVVVKRQVNRALAEELRNREVLNEGFGNLEKVIRNQKEESATETIKLVDARISRFMTQLERELVAPLQASQLARVEVRRLIEGLAEALEESQHPAEPASVKTKSKAAVKGK